MIQNVILTHFSLVTQIELIINKYQQQQQQLNKQEAKEEDAELCEKKRDKKYQCRRFIPLIENTTRNWDTSKYLNLKNLRQ